MFPISNIEALPNIIIILSTHRKFASVMSSEMVLWAALVHLALLTAVAAQDVLKFTSGVTNPAPVPGEPFPLTWTGGQASEPVYIVRNYYFGNTPNQDIIYNTEDILCEQFSISM